MVIELEVGFRTVGLFLLMMTVLMDMLLSTSTKYVGKTKVRLIRLQAVFIMKI
jgi:hypothetical protein